MSLTVIFTKRCSRIVLSDNCPTVELHVNYSVKMLNFIQNYFQKL